MSTRLLGQASARRPVPSAVTAAVPYMTAASVPNRAVVRPRSAAMIGDSAATGYAMLLAAILLSGAVQSASNPVTNKLIALHVAPGRRGTIIGIKQSGVQVGQFLTGVVLPVAALALGWRRAIALGLVPIALGWGLSVAFVPARGTTRPAVRTSAGRVQAPVGLWQLATYTFCNAALVAAVNVHVPLYAFDAVGLSATLAGGASGLIGGLGIVARISWARGAEGRRTFRGPLLLLAAMSLTAIPGQAVAMLALVSSTDRRRTGS